MPCRSDIANVFRGFKLQRKSVYEFSFFRRRIHIKKFKLSNEKILFVFELKIVEDSY
jgi:hypothetical protein